MGQKSHQTEKKMKASNDDITSPHNIVSLAVGKNNRKNDPHPQ